MKYIIFDITVATKDAAIMDNALKEIAYSAKHKEGAETSYDNVIMPFETLPSNLEQIEALYQDFLWACFKDTRGECNAEEFAPILPLFQDYDELLQYTTKIYVKKIITDRKLGVIYFDGSMSSAGCSGVAIHCKEEDPNGVYDAYTKRTRAYRAVGTVITVKPTNNVGELNGMCFAVDIVKENPEEYWVIIGDSEYTLKSFKEWRFGWAQNGWKTSQNKPIANADLIQHIASELDKMDKIVAMKWTKGHAGNPMNELCDLACKQMTGYS